MVKRIGKLFVIFLYINSLYNADQISLKLLDINGDVLSSVVAGEPFVLEAAVISQDSIPGIPQIAGIQNLHIEDKGHVSTINSVVNGVRSSKKIFQYRVSTDKIGLHTVGPALLVHGKQRLQSNVLTFEVSNEQKNQKKSDPFIRIIVDKKKIVKGEPILFTIRFFPLNSVNLEGISEPKLQDFSHEPLEGPFTGTQSIESETYPYIEWRTMLYPKKAGSLTIPSVTAVYKRKRKRAQSGFEMFDALFNSGFDQKQVQSNALTIDVQELPPSTKPASAVGNFTKFSAHVDHATAKEGEGIVYSLVLEGEGDLSVIESPELTMPEGLKYYDSKNTVDAAKKRKIFEYIIQGIRPGVWTIPAQIFRYFDLSSRSYKDLHSNVVGVTISADKTHTMAPTSVEVKKEEKTMKELDTIQPIYTHSMGTLPQERFLPWWLFLFVLVCLVLVGGYRTFFVLLKKITRRDDEEEIKKRKAFIVAKKAIKKAEEKKHANTLYDIFTTLFTQRLKQTTITQEEIEHYVKSVGFDVDQQKLWQTFFEKIVQVKFFPDHERHDILFSQALYWVSQWEKRL